MEPIPDDIRRKLFPGERLIWFGKANPAHALLRLSPYIAAAILWFELFGEQGVVLRLALPIFVGYLVLFVFSTRYVLTDSRVISISSILPPHLLYVNLINEIGTPLRIKLGWLGSIRFGELFTRQEDQPKWFLGGRVASLSFASLEDHKAVYDLVLSAQRSAQTASGTRTQAEACATTSSDR